jgi:hypothetical protein
MIYTGRGSLWEPRPGRPPRGRLMSPSFSL